ncbi:MAG: hypothetical protein K2J32_13510 [Ruminococcus sp.]|nr:hypothetical protein [Ruminococcus sp.]
MKNTFIKILVVAILFFGGVYYTHTPKFMLMRLADTASKSGDVSGYLTGDMKKAMKNVKKTESVLNLFTGDVSNEKFMNFIVQYLYTIEWELESIKQNGDNCFVEVDFEYDGTFDIDGTLTIKLEKEIPNDPIKKIISNPWKISSIEDIDF